MSAWAAFGWGALGGVLYQWFLLRKRIRETLARGETVPKFRWLLVVSLVTACFAGGVTTFDVAHRDVPSVIAIMFGVGWTSLLFVTGWRRPSPAGISERETTAPTSAAELVMRVRRFIGWWTTARLGTLIAFALFVIELLKYISGR
jgi:hypothetical protein